MKLIYLADAENERSLTKTVQVFNFAVGFFMIQRKNGYYCKIFSSEATFSARQKCFITY